MERNRTQWMFFTVLIYNGTALPFNELIKRMHELEERFH